MSNFINYRNKRKKWWAATWWPTCMPSWSCAELAFLAKTSRAVEAEWWRRFRLWFRRRRWAPLAPPPSTVIARRAPTGTPDLGRLFVFFATQKISMWATDCENDALSVTEIIFSPCAALKIKRVYSMIIKAGVRLHVLVYNISFSLLWLREEF